MLFPSPPERVGFLIDGDRVPNYEHRWARDHQGRLWVRKKEEDVGVEPIAAEIIGWHLSQLLDVPVPTGAIYWSMNNAHSTSWLSQVVTPALHWNPDRAHYINNLEDLGNILVLDVLILNSDRHTGNLLLEPDPDELHLHLWAIDAGNALVSYPTDFSSKADEIPAPPVAPGIPFEDIRDRAMAVSEKAATLLPAHVTGAVREAYELTGISEDERVAAVLCRRCKEAPELVSRYLSRGLP